MLIIYSKEKNHKIQMEVHIKNVTIICNNYKI